MSRKRNPRTINRRSFVGAGAGAAGLAALTASQRSAFAASFLQDADTTNRAISPDDWNPETIRRLAGTIEVNTAEEASKVVPLDHSGRVSYWYVGPNQASPEIDRQFDADFWAAFSETYPNIEVETQNLDYNQMLDKIRTAALGGAAPGVAKMPILWGVEFAAKGQIQPIELEEFNYTDELFWEGALKSVTWEGQRYGIPTNNETMALIWNKAIFAEAGLNPEEAPATWDDVVSFSKQIKESTGKSGYGLVARVNAGNTPFPLHAGRLGLRRRRPRRGGDES